MKKGDLVNTNVGPGVLYRIDGNTALVEFNFRYLVEMPLIECSPYKP